MSLKLCDIFYLIFVPEYHYFPEYYNTLIFVQFGTNVTLCQNGSGAVNNEWPAIKSSSGRLASFRRPPRRFHPRHFDK